MTERIDYLMTSARFLGLYLSYFFLLSFLLSPLTGL